MAGWWSRVFNPLLDGVGSFEEFLVISGDCDCDCRMAF